jgi:ribosomal protein L11 methyltransferase
MTGGWKVTVVVPGEAAATFTAALEADAMAVTEFEQDARGPWIVEAYYAGMPDRVALSAAVSLAAAATGIAEPHVQCMPLPVRDWLAENRESFVPIRIGRFFVHPSHFDGVPPPGAIRIQVDAASAFGSGEHASTRGCLLALDRLARRGPPGRVLDLGCGSGILAVAMAKLWRGQGLASDIDPEAVRVTRRNLRTNGVAGNVRVMCAKGFGHLALLQGAPYALIVANILARPLIGLAREIASRLTEPGTLIVSGILAEQAHWVAGAYGRCGLRLLHVDTHDGWSTLTLQR